MKRFPLACLALILCGESVLRCQAAEMREPGDSRFTRADPVISAIRGRTVSVTVPAGFESVTLQALAAPLRPVRASVPAARREWKTVGVHSPRKAAAVVEFRLDRLTPRRLLRVFGGRAEGWSGSLLTGITSFFPDESSITDADGNPVTLNWTDVPIFLGSTSTLSLSGGVSTEVRTVAEADIWKVAGDRLYFFNERRGLQVFDLHDPDDPAQLGTLRMAAMGEDMYLLDATHVVLLKKSWNWNWWDLDLVGGEVFSFSASSAAIGAAQSIIAPQRQANGQREIVIADVQDGRPRVVGRVEFQGTVRESRLVGKVLYLATDTHGPAVPGGPSAWGLEVTSFDLHDPAHPIRRAGIHLGGWAKAVSATDRTLLVAKSSTTGGTAVDILNISDPNGAMTGGGTVVVAGNVEDKFKLREAGGVLTVVSQKWRARTRQEIDALLNLPANIRPPDYVSASPVGITSVDTFSLANPTSPAPLGSLDLALDETLHATRFDGDRLYVVTAQHRPWIHLTYIWDPLWIVDLADPAQPRVLGELEMPGYSTYIEPLGDRLVTIGLVDGKPTVSLFDVSNAASPAELSRLALDARSWTSSEAVWNEKAFSVLPADNLILMPLTGWDWTSGATAGVQLLDLFRDRVAKRGLLVQPFAPRRATMHRGRIVAISPGTLLTIDATDRDVPRVTANLEIAWNVDRVFAIGGHVVQLGSEWSHSGRHDLTLTVTPADEPDATLATLTLHGAPLAETTVRDGVLYVLQIAPAQSWWDSSVGVHRESFPDHVTLSAVDLTRLPSIALLGSVTADISIPERSANGSGSARALWIDANTLGFNIAGTGRSFVAPYWYDPPPYHTYTTVWVPNPDAPSVDEQAIKAGSKADVTITQIYVGKSAGHYDYVKTGTTDPPGSWYASGCSRATQRVLAFDVRNPARLALASHLEIGDEQPWEVAPPVVVEGTLFASYQHLGALITEKEFAAKNARNPKAFVATDLTRPHRHFLQSVDYSDPRSPRLSPEHPNLPGRLIGAASGGSVLFTTGERYDPFSGAADRTRTVLHASALDGPVVHLLDQLPLPQDDSPPPLLRGRTVFQLKTPPARIWVPSHEPPPVANPGTTMTFTGSIPGTISLQMSGAAILQPAVIGDVLPRWNPGAYEDNPKKSTLTTWELGADGKFAQLAAVELAHERALHLFGNLGVVYERANQPRLLDVSDPASIGILGYVTFESTVPLNYSFADGGVGRGLWVPAGAYGIETFIFPK